MNVVVPRDTRISLEDGIAIQGTSPFSGVLLAADVPKRDGPSLFFGRFSADLGGAQTWRLNEVKMAGSSVLIPAGRYVLYAITDDAPLRARLTFEGLKKTTTLLPATQVALEMSTPQPSMSVAESGPVYSAGARGTVGAGYGLAYQAMIVEGEAHVVGHYGGCFYDQEPATPAGYLPFCPEARIRGYSTVAAADVDGYRIIVDGVTQPVPRGTWGQSVWYDAVAVPDRVRSVMFYLSYR